MIPTLFLRFSGHCLVLITHPCRCAAVPNRPKRKRKRKRKRKHLGLGRAVLLLFDIVIAGHQLMHTVVMNRPCMHACMYVQAAAAAAAATLLALLCVGVLAEVHDDDAAGEEEDMDGWLA